LISLRDDSETHRTVVEARKLKLEKLKEKKEKMSKWKEEKQMQKMVKKAFEKLVFKCGIVHHKVGSPYRNNISNTNDTGHAKKMSTLPAKREGQRFARKSAMLKKKLFTDNREQLFAPPNFKFKFNFSDFKKRADDKPKQKSGSIPKGSDVFKTVLTLCQSNLQPYCMGRKAAFFSVGI